MTSTSFVFTELANRMKYHGGGFLYNLVFTGWRHCVSQNEVWGRGCYITFFHRVTSLRFTRPMNKGWAVRQTFQLTLLQVIDPWSDELICKKTSQPNEIIINVLVSSFRFIWIPMLWVYGNYKYFYSYSAGIDFSRQNLTSTDVRFWRLKSFPAL